MTSSSGVTGACDQSPEFRKSDWSTKFCKLFLQVVDKKRQILAGTQNLPMKNWTKTVASDLKKVKKS